MFSSGKVHLLLWMGIWYLNSTLWYCCVIGAKYLNGCIHKSDRSRSESKYNKSKGLVALVATTLVIFNHTFARLLCLPWVLEQWKCIIAECLSQKWSCSFLISQVLIEEPITSNHIDAKVFFSLCAHLIQSFCIQPYFCLLCSGFLFLCSPLWHQMLLCSSFVTSIINAYNCVFYHKPSHLGQKDKKLLI